MHWNGTAWSTSASGATALPGGTYMVGVADISSADAYAIGDNSTFASGELEQWNGTTWSQVKYPLPAGAASDTTLNAISASGPNDVWIVGAYLDSASERNETFSLHWNGSAWSVVSMPLVTGSDKQLTYQFNSIVANSPTDVWAVGGSGDNALEQGGSPSATLIEHWNGSAWSIVPSPSPGTGADLTGVATSNASHGVWAVGSDTPSGTTGAQTLTLSWNGTAGRRSPVPITAIPARSAASPRCRAPRCCGRSAAAAPQARAIPWSWRTADRRLARRPRASRAGGSGIPPGRRPRCAG